MITFTPRGTCSRQIIFDLAEDNTIHNVKFMGGCNGNLQGIGRLIDGMDAADAITRLRGIDCNMKGTSCPDQLAKALEAALAQ